MRALALALVIGGALYAIFGGWNNGRRATVGVAVFVVGATLSLLDGS